MAETSSKNEGDTVFTLTDFGVSEYLLNRLPIDEQRGARIVAAETQSTRSPEERALAWVVTLKKPIPFWK